VNPHCVGQTVQFDSFAGGYRGRGGGEWRGGDERGRGHGGRGRGRSRGR
jgi:hypothetical protein